ncbi:chemotaxis protein CheW [Ureibacillus manganicus]|uniref:Chemotaxis protein CheW n=1 Tax=Ureibacillus manganicus DSM 26584 TaxID=1384049 RepID=A0A0A3I0Y4_9BACL|nr:CheW domain-containing protein [Ureibacillus manganicus]KGR78364.1 chemotaxis protein CheW [Ureibacillus manganicus DSM 26584]
MSFEKSIVFQSRTEEYAVPVEQVVSIEKMEKITPVPHLPHYLLGFTRIRGELIPVLDFGIILYNTPSPSSTSKLIVLNTEVVNYGLVVEEAKEILNFSEKELTQMGLVNYAKTQYFTAIANLENRMITCVDPKILVNSLEGIREIIEYLREMLDDENNH